MGINIIVAVAVNRAIGRQDDVIYFVSEDLKHFKQLTTGRTIIMGHKIFHPLSEGTPFSRRNIILNRTEADFPDCNVCSSLEGALKHTGTGEKVFIIGGASLYKEMSTMADHLCLTEIAAAPPQVNVSFPEHNDGIQVIESHEEHPAIDDNPTCTFVNYVRK